MADQMVVRLVCLRSDQKRTLADALESTGRFTFVQPAIVAPRNDASILAELQLNARSILEEIANQIASMDIAVK